MAFAEIHRPSPNFDASREHERLGVCFHHSAENFADSIAILTDPARRVSYHCLIDVDGTRCTFVADEHIAFHAGESRFRGRTACNHFLLGCAFAGNTYVAPLSPAQIESALEWLRSRWGRYAWSHVWMTDHRQVAPERKDDLKPEEWTRLLRAIVAEFPPVPLG
jgi:N-acetyl-anhydromuramoyl-L-alanine amidase